MRLLLIVSGLALLSLPGCSASEDMDKAEAAVARIHQQLDAGQSQAIYQAAAEEFKKSGSQADLVGFLDGVHDKLGKYKSGQRVNWKVNYGTSGEIVILDYKSDFENGQASEDFVFRIDGDKPVLLGYHVNSNVFIVSDRPRKT
jgi:opacity protein-like surface antigen